MTDDEGFGETVAASEPQVAATASPPRLIGRFVVDGPLGRGGMGLVVAAHDPDLDRKVAIKLLHDDGGGSVGRTRLMREAQAMARLRHPNVVTVHEAGTHEGRFYVAMELVPGGTLRSWMEAHPRASAAEVLEMFEPAGRGLVAAHAAGLVHRDFKPENVLIDADGRVLVTDFGLAGLHGARPAYEGERTDPGPAPSAMDATVMPEESARPVGDASSPLHQSLTRTGDVMGTPRYMSPEQHRGDPSTDARTDQFAFCAALYEALYGVRAFAGETYDAIRRNAEAGKLTPPGPLRDVPAAIHDAVLRGLRVEADDRWPSMEELLDALAPPAPAPGPAPVIAPPSRAPWIVVAVVAVAAIALAVVLLWPRAKADPLAKQKAAEAAAKACDCELLTVELPEGATLADEPLPTGQLAVPRGAQRIRYEADGETYAYAIVSVGAGASRTIALPAPERRDGFVFVPGGDVTIGDVEGTGETDERPVGVVHLAPYLIALDTQPARAKFADARVQAWTAHARLPTAAEWEWAARLGVAPGMAADQWEWTATRYAPYPYAADGRDDALAEGETIEVRGGKPTEDNPASASRRLEGHRAGTAEVRLARTPGATPPPREVEVRLTLQKSHPEPGTLREEWVTHPDDLVPFHAFLEGWAQLDDPPALQVVLAPGASWCGVQRKLYAVGVPPERIELVEAPDAPSVIVRWNPVPGFVEPEPERCRHVVSESRVDVMENLCFDGDVLRPETEATLDALAAAIQDNRITELVIDVHVATGTPDAYALSERRGGAVRTALFARGVKAFVIVSPKSDEPIDPVDPASEGEGVLLGQTEAQGPCDPGQAGLNDRVVFRVLARQ